MADIINHEYMNSFTQKIKEKSDRMRMENKQKLIKLKDYEAYKLTNTSMKRNSEIKKRYLTDKNEFMDPTLKLSDNRKFFSPQRDKSSIYGQLQSPIKKDFVISATRPS